MASYSNSSKVALPLPQIVIDLIKKLLIDSDVARRREDAQ